MKISATLLLFILCFLVSCQFNNPNNNKNIKPVQLCDTLENIKIHKNEKLNSDTIFLNFTSDLTEDEFEIICDRLVTKGKLRERNEKVLSLSYEKPKYYKEWDFEMIFKSKQYFFKIDHSRSNDEISFIKLTLYGAPNFLINDVLNLYRNKYGNYVKNSTNHITKVKDYPFQKSDNNGLNSFSQSTKKDKPDNRTVRINDLDTYTWSKNEKIKIQYDACHFFLDQFTFEPNVGYGNTITITYFAKKYLNELMRIKAESIDETNKIKRREQNLIEDI